MASIVYRGKAIIPAPLVEYQRERVSTRAGKPIGTRTVITLKGKVVAHKGSPNSSGTFHTTSGYPADETIAADARLGAILKKQRALKALFEDERGLLEITSPDGSFTRKHVVSNPKVTFSEGLWFEHCDYTVTLEADDPDDPAPILDSLQEAWSMEPADEAKGTYKLSRSLSAAARDRYDESGALIKRGWEYAKEYLLDANNVGGLGLKNARMTCPDVLDADSLRGYNYVRTQQVDEVEGTFAVTESWLCYDPAGQPPAVDDFTVEVTKPARSEGGGEYRVVVQGTVQGLEVRDTHTHGLSSTRWDNALAKWAGYVKPNLLARAEAYSGVDLNDTPQSEQTGVNPTTGVITYSAEYNDRPESPYLSESYRVSDVDPADVFAAIPVLGRPAGPVLQDIGSKTVRRRTFVAQIQTRAKSKSYTPSKPDVSVKVSENKPVGSQVFVDSDETSWDENSGAFSRQVGWTWEA